MHSECKKNPNRPLWTKADINPQTISWQFLWKLHKNITRITSVWLDHSKISMHLQSVGSKHYHSRSSQLFNLYPLGKSKIQKLKIKSTTSIYHQIDPGTLRNFGLGLGLNPQHIHHQFRLHNTKSRTNAGYY